METLALLDLQAACELIEANNTPEGIIAIDTETTGLDIRDGRDYCMGVSVAGRFATSPVLSGYYPFRHQGEGNLDSTDKVKLKEAIENFQGYVIFHNAKFDLVSLATLGINYTGKFYDTMLMCHLINENFPYSKELNSCVKCYIGAEESKKDEPAFKAIIKLVGWAGVPASAMADYAAWDANITFRLLEAILKRFKKDVPEDYWTHKQDFLRTIILMESRGIKIDVALCTRMSAIGRLQMYETEQILGYNLASPKDQYKLFIEDLKLPILKMGKKNPSFDKSVMVEYEQILELRDKDETAATVLTYRGWAKAVSSNYDPYVALLSPDGRLRPNYKLHGTKPGRMSCEKPNLQQIPRVSNKEWNGKMKAAFIPSVGYSLYEADYSQLEFRLGAAYGQQKNLLDIFNAEPQRDVFTEMSKELNLSRFNTKTLTYAIQFGAGGAKIGRMLGISEAEGKAIRENWYDTYSGIKKVSQKAAQLCYARGYVKLWTGRSRHFQYPSDESHKAFNSCIQGGAADIVNRVMVRLWKEVDDDIKCRMLLQVHDSVVFEIKNDYIDEYLSKIKIVMEDIPEFGVKFPVQIHVWGSE